MWNPERMFGTDFSLLVCLAWRGLLFFLPGLDPKPSGLNL
jgi:hypothetical protein